MDDQEVCDQLLTLLVAGHETTATALAWTVDLLLHHPAALDRLVAGSAGVYLRAVITSRCGCGRSCRSPAGGWPPS